MQTFITDSGATLGVDYLDDKRLNKQLLEARQILNIIVTLRDDPDSKIAWRNHPAVKMWMGCEYQLFRYCVRLVIELKARGIKYKTNYYAINAILSTLDNPGAYDDKPAWMVDPVQLDKVITTHRASLYKKDPAYYVQFKYESDWVDSHRDAAVCCGRCNYYWPTHVEV